MADTVSSNGTGGLFIEPAKGPRELPIVPIAIAGGVVLVALALLIIFARGHARQAANAPLPLDPYANSLAISNIKMSESTSLSNGKDTYIDGTLTNHGSRTVTAATVQVIFRNDMDLSPQFESLPLMLIRSREPYIDIQPVSAAPIAPGASADFRLTFEDITSSWNQQLPEIRFIEVATK